MSLSHWRLRVQMAGDASYMGTQRPITRKDGTHEKAKPSADPKTITVRMNGTKDRHLV
jgi:hypothetical protein